MSIGRVQAPLRARLDSRLESGRSDFKVRPVLVK